METRLLGSVARAAGRGGTRSLQTSRACSKIFCRDTCSLSRQTTNFGAASKQLRPITTSSYARPLTKKSPFSRRKIQTGVGAIAVVGVGLGITTIYAASADEKRPLAEASWSELGRRYFVYTCCNSQTLIDWSAKIIEYCQESKIPGLASMLEWFMLHSFFPQFVGGQTVEACMQTVERASQLSIGSVLAFSAEAKGDKPASSIGADVHKLNCATSRSDEAALAHAHLHMDKVNEMMHSICVSGEFSEQQKLSPIRPRRDNSILVAIKLSGLLRDPSVLERASACLMPREEWVSPPSTRPPSNRIAVGACPGLMIPTSALSDDDVGALKALWYAMQAMATCARDHGHVRLLLDAEYSWFQPAIDAMFESCAQKYNRLPSPRSESWIPWLPSSQGDDRDRLPLIYNTYQAYLRRTPAYLAMSLERARTSGYSLGIKLVRGAYVEIENNLWNTTIVDTPPAMNIDGEAEQGSIRDDGVIPALWKSPVWPSKRLTDECYDACVERIMDEIKKDMDKHGAQGPAHLAVVFAGHNWDSSVGVIRHMLRLGLARKPVVRPTSASQIPTDEKTGPVSPFTEDLRGLHLAEGVRGRIHLGQLYGMADDLTHTIRIAFDSLSGGDGPHIALKYIPYGSLELTMPYLTRRANENKSVMGSGRATRERALVVAEIGHRIRSWIPGLANADNR